MAHAGPAPGESPGAVARGGHAQVPVQATPASPERPPPMRGVPARALPPGQQLARVWPVRHYGPVPVFRPERWDLRCCGATASGTEHRWDWPVVSTMPRVTITADMHCVTKFTVQGLTWQGIAATEILALAPPAPEVTHVMVWAEFGFSASIPVSDFAGGGTLFATHGDGRELTPEHGYPLRLVVPHRYGWKSVKWVRAVEYLTTDRRGYWEARGYHNNADPWQEQRYSYQEAPGEGPPF